MIRLAPSLFVLLLTTLVISAIHAAPGREDLHSRFFQEENMEKQMSNDIGDVLPRYKSEPKLNRILFGGHGGGLLHKNNNKKGLFHRRKNHGQLGGLLGHKGEQKWRNPFPQRVEEIHYQDVSYDAQQPPLRRPLEGEIPETPRMTPNRLHHYNIKKNNNRKKAQKKSAHSRRIHHLNKLKQLGKSHDEKALWKLMNNRAKYENHASKP